VTARSTDGRARLAERRAARAELTDLRPVLDAAGRYLEVRPRAAGEVRRHLVAAGYPTALVEATIVTLTAAGYLDDEAFARAWVESRDRTRPRGEAALRRELLAHGVDADVAGRAIAERSGAGGAGSADQAAARRLLDRRGRSLVLEADPRRRRERAYALLARSGFDPGTCREAVVRWLAEGGESGEEIPADGE
jgi:regulatory protein